jgi:hypothetical protein
MHCQPGERVCAVGKCADRSRARGIEGGGGGILRKSTNAKLSRPNLKTPVFFLRIIDQRVDAVILARLRASKSRRVAGSAE